MSEDEVEADEMTPGDSKERHRPGGAVRQHALSCCCCDWPRPCQRDGHDWNLCFRPMGIYIVRRVFQSAPVALKLPSLYK